MNKKKTIALKDPRLRAIRNSLRKVIDIAIHKEMDKLFDLMKRENRETTDGYEKYWKLSDMKYALKSSLETSIIECPACNCIDRDMRYNPYDEAWYCIDCFKLIGDMYYETMAKKDKGHFVGRDYDEKFARSFTEDGANIAYEIEKLKADMDFQIIDLEQLSLEVELLGVNPDSDTLDYIVKMFFVAWIDDDEQGFGEVSYLLAPFFTKLKNKGLYEKLRAENPMLDSVEEAGKKLGLLN